METLRINETGTITGIRYMGSGADIAPFTPVGSTTYVVDACTRKVFTVKPGVPTENREAGAIYMIGKNAQGADVLIAFEPQASDSATHRGMVVTQDWGMTVSSQHLMRRFSTLAEAEAEAEKSYTVTRLEDDQGWMGVMVAGALNHMRHDNRLKPDTCAVILNEHLGMPRANGLTLRSLYGANTALVVERAVQPFPHDEAMQGHIVEVTISPLDTNVTVTAALHGKCIAFLMRRTFSYREALKHLTL